MSDAWPQAPRVSHYPCWSMSAAMCRGAMLDPFWGVDLGPRSAPQDGQTKWVPEMVARCSGQCLWAAGSTRAFTCPRARTGCGGTGRRCSDVCVSIIWILFLGFAHVVEVMGQFSSIRCRVVKPCVSLELGIQGRLHLQLTVGMAWGASYGLRGKQLDSPRDYPKGGPDTLHCSLLSWGIAAF